MKLILNPAYVPKQGFPECDHERTVIQLGNLICEFCDECGVVWVRRAKDEEA